MLLGLLPCFHPEEAKPVPLVRRKHDRSEDDKKHPQKGIGSKSELVYDPVFEPDFVLHCQKAQSLPDLKVQSADSVGFPVPLKHSVGFVNTIRHGATVPLEHSVGFVVPLNHYVGIYPCITLLVCL